MKNIFKNKLGFTFLEILVAFSIIGIIAGVGFASFTTYSRKQILDQAAADLKNGIDEAKFNAISRIKPVDLLNCGDTSPLNKYEILLCASNLTPFPCTPGNMYEINAICGSNVKQVKTVKLPSGLVMETDDCDKIQFFTQSGTDNTSCAITLTLTSDNNKRLVEIDGGGNVSITKL